MTPGLYPDMPDAIYRKEPGLSVSALKHFIRSPGHYRYAMDHPTPPTAAMCFGRVFHHLVLTPTLPPCWTVVESVLTKDSKARIAAGECLISVDAMDTAKGVAQAVLANPVARKAIGAGEAELSWFAPFNLGGTVERKGRIDFANTGTALVDLKTISDDAREESVAREIEKRMYHVQAAYYLDGYNTARPEGAAEKTAFVFIFVEKEPPFGVAVYRLKEQAIQVGREIYVNALQRFMVCVERNEWPIYEPAVSEIDLSAYAYARRH
jgi:hypothetical protein